jgi:adenosylmethionine-8-amino-7-oxononanoate aminotransferase
MAKGLTSGYVPMGAAVVSGPIGEALPAPFLHINTYAGHPVASVVALEALEILRREQLVEASARLGEVLASAFADLEASADGHIARSWAIGLLGGVEFRASSDAHDLPARLRHEMYERGVAARAGLGDGLAAVLFYPPLVVDERDVLEGVAAVGEALSAADFIPS